MDTNNTKMKLTTVKLDGKTFRVLYTQERLAQQIAWHLHRSYVPPIIIPTGYGKRIIMQRVADLMSPSIWYKTKKILDKPLSMQIK